MTFYVTFGSQYNREPHPALGMRSDLPERTARAREAARTGGAA